MTSSLVTSVTRLARPLSPVLVASLLVAATAAADVLFVPGDHPTINEAIEVAVDGDIIEVASGIYRENLVISGKQIAIRGSQVDPPTVIDGSAPVNDCGSCVLVTGGSLLLDHLVLRNGTGCPVFGITRGGGIYAEFAVVEVINTVIEDCVLKTEPFGSTTWGGGICSYFGSLVVEGSTIRGNRADGEGGGIWSTHATLLVGNSRIEDNHALLGGGVLIEGGEASIDFSTLRGNTALAEGGAALVRQAAHAGFYDVRFDANAAPDGAGIWSSAIAGAALDCIFSEQVADSDGATVRLDDLDLVFGDYVLGGNRFCGSTGVDVSGQWVEGEPNEFLERCPPAGDLDGDGLIDGADLSILLGAWGAIDDRSGPDLDLDGVVDGADLTILLGNWTG